MAFINPHLGLVADAKVAINKVHSDPSVPRSVTKESLEDLSVEIEMMLDSLDENEDEEAE